MDSARIDQSNRYKTVFYLAVFTIIYNVVEGLLATNFGYTDQSLSLLGFGVDSFVEVISGIGIAHMIWRIWNNKGDTRDDFEKTALKITGVGFYIIVVYLTIQATYNIIYQKAPINTFWGIIISSISIMVMWVLILWKTKLGKLLKSDAIIADAACARVCLYMSFVLLISGFIYKFTGFIYSDSIGALGIAYLSFIEGKECFEKSNSDATCLHDC